MHYVTLIGVSRHYGGSEEGGWWYDWVRVISVVRSTKRICRKIAKSWALAAQEDSCPYGRGSVLGGEDLSVVVSKKRVNGTTERPTYY